MGIILIPIFLELLFGLHEITLIKCLIKLVPQCYYTFSYKTFKLLILIFNTLYNSLQLFNLISPHMLKWALSIITYPDKYQVYKQAILISSRLGCSPIRIAPVPPFYLPIEISLIFSFSFVSSRLLPMKPSQTSIIPLDFSFLRAPLIIDVI